MSQDAYHEANEDAQHASHCPNHDLLREEESPCALENACADPPGSNGRNNWVGAICWEHLRHSEHPLPNEDGSPNREGEASAKDRRKEGHANPKNLQIALFARKDPGLMA